MKRAQYGGRGKPWEAERISKATWYRRHANDANIVSQDDANIVSPVSPDDIVSPSPDRANIVSQESVPPPRPIPRVARFTLIASDPPSLLDHPSLRAYREPETEAKVAILQPFESEDAPAAKRAHAREIRRDGKGSKIRAFRIRESPGSTHCVTKTKGQAQWHLV
jgi:hypothetical protein